MKQRRTVKTKLPRVVVYAMSAKELLRFSQAMEQVAGLSHLMVGLMTRLDACVTRLEKRTAAARKANQTRQAAAADQAADVGGGAAAGNGEERP